MDRDQMLRHHIDMVIKHHASQVLQKQAKEALFHKELKKKELMFCKMFEHSLEEMISLPKREFDELMDYWVDLVDKHYTRDQKNLVYKRVQKLNRKVLAAEKLAPTPIRKSSGGKKALGVLIPVLAICGGFGYLYVVPGDPGLPLLGWMVFWFIVALIQSFRNP